MTDFEKKLIEVREQLEAQAKKGLDLPHKVLKGFDACAAIAREVVAEKDAEIAKRDGWVTRLQNDAKDDRAYYKTEITRREAEIARLTKENAILIEAGRDNYADGVADTCLEGGPKEEGCLYHKGVMETANRMYTYYREEKEKAETRAKIAEARVVELEGQLNALDAEIGKPRGPKS
jgi:hypothetical protein